MKAPETPISHFLAQLSPARDRVECESGKLLLTAVEVPAVAPSRIYLQRGSIRTALAWDEGGQAFVGLGALCELRARGAGRFEEIKRQSEALWKRIERASDSEEWQPRLFGGFSFQPGGADSPEWQNFGDAHFFLPRLSYWTDGRRAQVGIAIAEEQEGAAGLSERRNEILRLFTALAAQAEEGSTKSSFSFTPAKSWLSFEDLEAEQAGAFQSKVTQIVDAIDEGKFAKVVTARCSNWTLDGEVEPALVWDRLRAGSDGGSATFSFQFDGTTFLGSTPERLLELQGRELYTEAIAGTLPADEEGNEQRLLESAKNRMEHDFVFQELQHRLMEVSNEVSFSSEPTIKRLHYALHLHTPFRATLKGGQDIFQLLRLLHPTPAVAGQPSLEALRWIKENEGVERGWYAGPVGWMTSDGDGTFWVALRSGFLCSGEARLYAGAGIVRDSDPASEYAETELKLRPLLEALGARR